MYLGALCAQFVSDGLGRRRAFQVSAIIFIVGLSIMSLSMNYWILLFGRMFVGLGVGFGLAIDPIYISEISRKFYCGVYHPNGTQSYCIYSYVCVWTYIMHFFVTNKMFIFFTNLILELSSCFSSWSACYLVRNCD